MLRKLLVLVMIAAFSLAVVACEKEGPAEKAGKKIDNTVEKAGEKMEELGDKIEKKTEN